MINQGFIPVAIYFIVALLLVKPLGRSLRRAYEGEPTLLGRLLRPLERRLCLWAGVPALPDPLPREAEMSWGGYLLSMLAFLGAGVVLARGLGSLQVAPRAGSIVQSLLSAMLGLSLLIALHRGLRRLRRHDAITTAGNFWMDLIRGSLYILFPLALLLALLLVSQEILQTGVTSVSAVLLRGP